MRKCLFSRIKARPLTMIIVLLTIFGAGCRSGYQSTDRWGEASGNCFKDARPGDTIYPILPLRNTSTDPEIIPFSSLTLPQSTTQLRGSCASFQGGHASISFEMDANELDAFLTANFVTDLRESNMPPDFGPTAWLESSEGYQYASRRWEENSAYVRSAIWIDQTPGDRVYVYILVMYGG